MEFGLPPEVEAFRAELDAWLAGRMQDAPDSARRLWLAHTEPTDDAYAFAKTLQHDLIAKGWYAVGWPKAYGGAGLSVYEQAVYNDAMYRHRAPQVYGFGLNLVGPTLILFGTEEQKQRFLPAIARGEIVIWQCFTEPDGGSDLASLKCAARATGAGYRLTGQKMFVGDSHPVDYLYVLARTDPAAPKHAGISAFLIAADSPGITISPLSPLSGSRKNIIYFDDVLVPKANLLGEENRGWNLAVASLGLERSGLGAVSALQRAFEEFVEHCRTTPGLAAPLPNRDREGAGHGLQPDCSEATDLGGGSRAASGRIRGDVGERYTSLADARGSEAEAPPDASPREVTSALLDDSLVEQRVGELAADLAVKRLLTLRNLWIQGSGRRFSYETSQSALLNKQFIPKFARYALEITQQAGLIKEGSPGAGLDGAIEYLQRTSLVTHGGGTPEIQKNIIATRGLALPRGT